jgi:hypothetical protein
LGKQNHKEVMVVASHARTSVYSCQIALVCIHSKLWNTYELKFKNKNLNSNRKIKKEKNPFPSPGLLAQPIRSIYDSSKSYLGNLGKFILRSN